MDVVQVDADGSILVSCAGRINTDGNNPDTTRRIITDRLQDQAPDPQLLVSRSAGDRSTVSIIGAVIGQDIYVLERPTRTASAMLAKSGGVNMYPELAQITVIRGLRREKVGFGIFMIILIWT